MATPSNRRNESNNPFAAYSSEEESGHGGGHMSGGTSRKRSFMESAKLFDSPPSLSSELRKARLYRGRIRGEIHTLQEQVGNIIITSEKDKELIEILGRKEEDLRKALDEAGAYVVELELRYDKLNERTAREIALSRISEGLLSQIGSSDSEDETRKSPRAALRSSTAHHRDALPPPPPPPPRKTVTEFTGVPERFDLTISVRDSRRYCRTIRSREPVIDRLMLRSGSLKSIRLLPGSHLANSCVAEYEEQIHVSGAAVTAC
ncbi:hypothetical protein FOZ60_008151 [Perkinsus olseni]|uniref:Uncharacterized protein n=1 Tax=Perkinsus olseni TaxID=32597 RepID=A0A7J6NJU8_PEROL|nr:hypothetical protein FOZ60_008151 [Perkinsus olseni]